MKSIFLLRQFINKNSLLFKSNRSLTISSINQHASSSNDINQKLSYAVGNSDGYTLVGQTVREKLNLVANEKPDFEMFKFNAIQKGYTTLELKQRVDELAQSLLNLGFQKGDNLALCLPNVPEMVIGLLAAGSIGVVSVLMNPAYQQNEVEYMLKKTKAKGILILDNIKSLQHYDLLKRICPEIETSKKGELESKNLPHLKHVVMVKNRLVKNEIVNKNIWSYEEIENHSGIKRELPCVDIDDPFAMLFTSGTTGLPKAALMSNLALVNTAILTHAMVRHMQSERVICCPIPIFHTMGLVIGALGAIVNNSKMVSPHLLIDAVSNIRAIEREKCTIMIGPPTMFIDLLNNPMLHEHDLSSLETVLLGAATVPKNLLTKIKKTLSIKNIIIGYAMTETGCGGSVTNQDDLSISERYGYESIGKTTPFLETKIIDPKTNQIVPRNTDGELCIRGFSVMKGYYDEPDKTAESLDKNGWFRTGDIVSMDENGYNFFKSRAKEVVIRGGINIYPAEIETFLRTNENVFDCYVIGVPDKRVGEELCVWIKLKPNRNVDEQSIREYFDCKIANFKIPKYIKFVDSFPVNATGKVQKFKMQEQMKKELNL